MRRPDQGNINPTPHPDFQFLDGAFPSLQGLLLSLLQLQCEVSEVLLLVLLDPLQVGAPVLLLPELLAQSRCLEGGMYRFYVSSVFNVTFL